MVINEIKGNPFERMSIDVAEPYRHTTQGDGSIYNLTIQNNSSKYIRFTALLETSGEKNN